MASLPRWLTRQTVLSKDGLGTLVVTAARWAPGRVRRIDYYPGGNRAVHAVPEPVWEDVLVAGSFEEVMALIRSVPGQG